MQSKNKLLAKLRVLQRRMNKTLGKLLIVLLIVAALFFGARFFVKKAGLPKKGEIHRAAARNETLRIFFWLSLRPQVAGERDRDKRTPLHVAAAGGKKGPAVCLTFWGADVSAADKDGQTPLHVAAYHGRDEMAEFLIRKGANVEARDQFGRTPLSQAILWNKKSTADVLRNYGASE
jgi:ankyrin repeat protein